MALDLQSALREGLSDEPVPTRASGIEIRLDLLPAGGMPVQPPSYEGDLEIHERHIDGQRRQVIELDSVGSAANRLEEVLSTGPSRALPAPRLGDNRGTVQW